MAMVSGAAAAANNAASATTTQNPKSKLKVEDFINMMVTQLKNQDPTKPEDNGQLLQQMSQIGQLQSQQALQSSLTSLVAQNSVGSAANLIGKDVSGLDSTTGETLTGKVKSVKVQSGNVILQLDSGASLPMSQVDSITTPNADISAAVGSSAGAIAAAN